MDKSLFQQLVKLAEEEFVYGELVINNDGTYAVNVKKTPTGKCKDLASAINGGMGGGDVKITHEDAYAPVDEEISRVQLPQKKEFIFKPKTQTQQVPPL